MIKILSNALSIFAAAAVLSLTSCMNNGDDTPNNPGGTGSDPEEEDVVDPNPKELNPLIAPLDNPQAQFDGIYMTSDQRLASTGDWRFVNLETVNSIDAIKTIPWQTWVESTYIKGGYGLLAYNPKFGFWTVYVDNIGIDENMRATYAALVYRKNFNGCDQRIDLKTTSLEFDAAGGSEYIDVTTKTFTSYQVSSNQSWCRVELNSSQGLTFLPNRIFVTVEPNDSPEPRTATIMVGSIWGKNTIVDIAQAGVEVDE